MVRVFVLCAFAALLALPDSANSGGLERTDVTTTEVSKAAEFAVQQINSQSNNIFAMILSSIVEASSQVPVVSGMKYTLIVEVLPSTDCRNDGELHTLCSCSADTTSKPVGYKVEVWLRPWMIPSMQMLSFKHVPLASENPVDGVPKAKILSIASAISSSSVEFQQFLKTYTPSYCNNAVELSNRSDIFQDNMLRIKEIQEAEQGSAKYGVTKFADLTESEFRGQNAMAIGVSNSMKQAPLLNTEAAPTSFDWRDHFAVTSVKNNKGCRADWAFSALGNIEGQWAIKRGQLISLSVQELLDCSGYKDPCTRPPKWEVFPILFFDPGLSSEIEYPYTGKLGKCQADRIKKVVFVNGSLDVSPDEAQMAAWLAVNGPIIAVMDSSAMRFYTGGVAHPLKMFCSKEKTNHAIEIVGYGVKKNKPYWIIKTSWGKSWGEEGYYYLYRGDNSCGINRWPQSYIVD